jgi:glycosyltransferase involved in cell wall biosynthesis
MKFYRGFGYLYSTLYTFNPRIDRFLDSLLRGGYRLARHLRKYRFRVHPFRRFGKYFSRTSTDRLDDFFPSSMPTYAFPFSPGDIVLTLGLDWDTRILERLHSIKADAHIRIVTVVYDIIPLDFPQYLSNVRHATSLLRHFTYLAKSSDLILLNTKYCAERFALFVNRINLPEVPSNLVRWAGSLSNDIEPSPIAALYGKVEEEGFVLIVGSIEIRKNHQLLIQIVNLARERNVRIPKIVVVGREGWGAGDTVTRFRTDETLRQPILWLIHVSDNQLAWLYQNCLALLSPSFEEGFGLPVAEAAIYGKNLILSDIEVYHELFPTARFVSPFDPVGWLYAILENDSSASTEHSPFADFTWQDTANQVQRAIENHFGLS